MQKGCTETRSVCNKKGLSKTSNDEETVASGASQAIISFNPIPPGLKPSQTPNIMQSPQPLIAQMVQEVGNPHAIIDPAMENQGVHLILVEEETTTEGLLNTFYHNLFTLYHCWVNAFRSISTRLIQDILINRRRIRAGENSILHFVWPDSGSYSCKNAQTGRFNQKLPASGLLTSFSHIYYPTSDINAEKVVTMREKAMRRSSQALNSRHRRRSDHIVIIRYKKD
jgi:hypothetical protein